MLRLEPLSSSLIPLLVLVASFVVRLCWPFVIQYVVRCVMVCRLVLVVSSVVMSLVVVVMV